MRTLLKKWWTLRISTHGPLMTARNAWCYQVRGLRFLFSATMFLASAFLWGQLIRKRSHNSDLQSSAIVPERIVIVRNFKSNNITTELQCINKISRFNDIMRKQMIQLRYTGQSLKTSLYERFITSKKLHSSQASSEQKMVATSWDHSVIWNGRNPSLEINIKKI